MTHSDPTARAPSPTGDTAAVTRLRRLNALLHEARNLPHYRAAYTDVATTLDDLADLEGLPVLRKQDFIDLQRERPPFGGLMAADSRPDYLFVSPGPIHEPGFMQPSYWRMDRALSAAGFGANDIVHNTFSYHLTPGAWIFDAGARALGCAVIPAGNAPVDVQLQAIHQYGASGYTGTPDFLKRLIEAYAEAGLGAFPITRALVSGGAFTPGLEAYYAEAGIEASQCYATAELGLIACDTAGCEAMRIDDDLAVEIVDPDTGRAVPPGETGEVVVTTLRADYPLIRFGTGDLSAFAPDGAPDGAPALVGWLGRSDQAIKLRGLFIRPQQLQALQGGFSEVSRMRLVVDRDDEQDTAVLFCGVGRAVMEDDGTALQERIAARARSLCRVKIDVSIVDEDTMSDDGKLVVDRR